MNKVHITNHSGKMLGIPSINTNNSTNEFCIRMSKCNGLICNKCYANRLIKLRPSLDNKLTYNSELLSSKPLQKEQIPIFNNLFVRIHSFGELINLTHLDNIITIVNSNPKVTFTLYSKRVDLIKTITEKPKNLILIYSNPLLDKDIKKIPKNYDKIFSVFTKDYVKQNSVKINCQKSCLNCQICYTSNSIKYVKELIK